MRNSEEDFDQLLFEEGPLVRQAVQEALEDVRRSRFVTLKDYLRGKRSPYLSWSHRLSCLVFCLDLLRSSKKHPGT